jgi:hypothetical protein
MKIGGKRGLVVEIFVGVLSLGGVFHLDLYLALQWINW